MQYCNTTGIANVGVPAPLVFVIVAVRFIRTSFLHKLPGLLKVTAVEAGQFAELAITKKLKLLMSFELFIDGLAAVPPMEVYVPPCKVLLQYGLRW